MITAYHFVGATLRDGRAVPPDGEWLVHEGEAVMCESGLHASRDPFDALSVGKWYQIRCTHDRSTAFPCPKELLGETELRYLKRFQPPINKRGKARCACHPHI